MKIFAKFIKLLPLMILLCVWSLFVFKEGGDGDGHETISVPILINILSFFISHLLLSKVKHLFHIWLFIVNATVFSILIIGLLIFIYHPPLFGHLESLTLLAYLYILLLSTITIPCVIKFSNKKIISLNNIFALSLHTIIYASIVLYLVINSIGP